MGTDSSNSLPSARQSFIPGRHGARVQREELTLTTSTPYRAERLKRRSLAQLQRLGYQVTLTPLPTAA